MAEATIPTTQPGPSLLDRPLLPSVQRITALLAHRELLAYSAITLAAFLMRIWDVGSRAMHHDESLHAYYAWQLFTGQGYSYDPLMHGPFQFEVVPIFYLLFSSGEFAARMLAVILGTVMVVLPYFLRHHLTRPGALLASVMLAISPGMVYFSRFIRDDIYLACFALALFICIVRYVETHRARFVYLGSGVLALAVASMEASYILIFIFGSFIVIEAVREILAGRDGIILQTLKTTSIDTWLTGIAIFVVTMVLLYSTFFTDPYGIWDTSQPFFASGQSCGLAGKAPAGLNPCRKDIVGGIIYWLAQHDVDRGGQPWFYYLLVLPLYEQLAVVFGMAGMVYAAFRRSFFSSLLTWWALMSILLYSWAGEKMPWLSIHITLPLIILAGMFLGRVLSRARFWPVLAAAILFIPLFALETHSTFALNYEDGANPTEMLIYVQTSPDVPKVVNEISRLSHRKFGGDSMPIGLDDADVGGWPFIWYLRDYPSRYETTDFSGPACGAQYCPVLLLLSPEYDQYSAQLRKHYVVAQYRWNWWFPEDYKVWFPEHVGSIPLALAGKGTLSSTPMGSSTDWRHLWDWLVYRQPFGDRGARMMYFLVRKDLVPHARQYSGTGGGTGGTTAPPVSETVNALPSRLFKAAAPGPVLSGPRGVATAPNGNVYAANPLSHRIVEFSASGALLRSFGTVGSGNGQFSSNDSPLGVAVARNGNVFVADTWNQRIEVFSPTGKYLRQWGGGAIGSGTDQFFGPRSLAIGPNGRVYVADTGNKRIQIFTQAGTFVSSFGVSGAEDGQFNEPSSVAIGPKGNVYVSDFWNQRIQEFTANGSFIRSWSVPDWTPGSYDEPYLAVDARSGDVYASDPGQRRVLVWSSNGAAIGAISDPNLTLPIGVAVQPNGHVAVTDATAGALDLFRVRVVPPKSHPTHVTVTQEPAPTRHTGTNPAP